MWASYQYYFVVGILQCLFKKKSMSDLNVSLFNSKISIKSSWENDEANVTFFISKRSYSFTIGGIVYCFNNLSSLFYWLAGWLCNFWYRMKHRNIFYTRWRKGVINWILCGVTSFYNVTAYEIREKWILKRFKRPGFSLWSGRKVFCKLWY